MTPKDPEAWRVHRPTASSIWKEIKVEGFPRASQNIWDLLFRSLRMGVGERNEKAKKDHMPAAIDPKDIIGKRYGALTVAAFLRPPTPVTYTEKATASDSS